MVSAILGGQYGTILAIGLALGTDAFSLGIGLGVQGLRWRDILRLSALIGLFHLALPLCSILIGDVLHTLYGGLFQKLAAIILMFLGSKMTIEAIMRQSKVGPPPFRADIFALVTFAATVSLDSLSAGFSLGTLDVNPLVASITFGILGGMMSWLGLYLGRKVNHVLGAYAEIAGGVVLIVLGMKFFW